MKIYLVGGAVRDKLLAYPFHERDWVVVGAGAEQLLKLGYQQVGRDFPVFLHPNTKEEYALARTEKKAGSGYTGFLCESGPEVSLEEDLKRRDLTINAMAEDDNGRIIDPYGGQKDLREKRLRHVSNAFIEDPLRVLRVARFAARYAYLGFYIADETQQLMHHIAQSGELNHLVSERIWKETERALSEQSPIVFFQVLRDCGALRVIFPELDQLFGIEQPKKHHPEIDCGIHSLMVLQQASRLCDHPAVRFAALIHDLGKGLSNPDYLPRHSGHESAGLPLINQLCERIRAPKEYLQLALLVGEYHSHCHRALELKPKTILKLFSAIDVFRRPQRLEHFLLSCEADAKGRRGCTEKPYPQADFLRRCAYRCANIQPGALIEQGLSGKALGEAIYKQRLLQIEEVKATTRSLSAPSNGPSKNGGSKQNA